jgi:nucleotide-binding universal stress UspA family protein
VAKKRILAPTDFSPASEGALKSAIDLAAVLGAEVHVLHVVPLLAYAIAPEAMPDAPDFERKLKAELATKLEQTVQQLSGHGVEVKGVLLDGNPGHEIARLAHEEGYDLNVMPTHGRTGLAHVMLGSVAERVVRTAQVPVLTVR